MSMVPATLRANPQGEVVVGGAAGFNRPDAATLIVNQNTDRAVINWNSFSIANGELTKFVQPSSSSAVLNRVVTANPSAIYGTLQANGNVYLINPGGVLVGAGGVVNTASFVASTHDMNTEEFMKGGQLNFKGNSDASVINQGNITAREGDVFLIAKEVKNEGQLMAKDGTVGMVSGTEVSLQAVGQGNFKVRLMAAETDPTSPRTSQGEGGSPSRKASESAAEIVNEGVIQAANAVLEAKGSYLPMAIKNTGVIEATGLVENGDGSVTLTGGEGDILNTGVVAALQRSLDGQKETGGSIMMTAKNVTSDIGSVITASGKDGGGAVKLRSADTTILRGSIEVVGQADSAQGGNVQLLGERVGLFDQAKVDASGGAGGGEVLVGGDYLGKNPNVPNAKAVVLGSEAKIIADATSNGNGGRVILWSDEYTGFYGEISAQGGEIGGKGGFVETSSKLNLVVQGWVDVGSRSGAGGGHWLIDPKFINIETPAGSTAFPPAATSAANTFTSNAGGTNTIDPRSITQALNGGASLTLQANTDINVNENVNYIEDNGLTRYIATGPLTLQAGRSILVNANIDIGGNLTMTANDSGADVANRDAGVGNIVVGGTITSRAGDVLMTVEGDSAGFPAGSITINSTIQAGGGDVTISSIGDDPSDVNGNITIGASISAYTGTTLTSVNLSTGDATHDGGFINQTGGTITAATLNATTLTDEVTPVGGAGAYIYLGSSNDMDNISLRALDRAGANQDALIYYNDSDGFNINGNGIRSAGNVTLEAAGDITQSIILGNPNASVQTLGLGIVTTGSVTLTRIDNDILNLANDLRNPDGPGDLAYTDSNGFNVAFVDTDFPNVDQTDTRTIGIRADDVVLITEEGTQAGTANGIRLRNTPGTLLSVRPAFQYSLLNALDSTLPSTDPVPGHIESAGNVTITVRDPGGTADTRFTLDEGIHLFAGMGGGFEQFDNTVLVAHGVITLTANNMVLGMDTDPNLAMHGLIMTQDINQAGVVNDLSGVFLAPYGFGAAATLNRGVQIVSPKTDYDVTADPGFFQLSNGELNRINTSRLQIQSSFDVAGTITPAVDVRSALSMNGLYDVTTVSGIFPNTPGVNRLELWASGGLDSNVQVSADISSDATSTTSTTPTPMQIFLSAAVAGNGAQGGVVNVNAGLRSNGGNIALQGDKVNINGLINANSPNNADLLGLVALFPAQTGANVNLGSKVVPLDPRALGILRDEVALITAGTVQVGISFLPPKVLRPTNPFNQTFLSGSNPLWTVGDLGSALLAGVNTGTLTVSDLIADLSINTLALLADGRAGGTALSQANNNAGIKVPGLLIGGAPGTAAAAAPGTDYILNSTLNEFDRFAVALTTTLGQDATGAGAPTGDLLLVNSKGLVGGNSGEVARTGQQWEQGLIRANVLTAPLYTGIGLVAARALSITAAGPVSIYETLPAGVAGVGQYMGHVSANPNIAAQMDQTEVGNQIGVINGTSTTVGLAVNTLQNAPGESGANSVWAAAARGLAISDLSGAISGAVDGILTNGGNVTLEGNAIEIADAVTRAGGNNITIDTTGASTGDASTAIAPGGARVTIRPATGQNGFQDRLGSGAYDPNLQNSPLAGAPVEINLGSTSTQAGADFPAFIPTFLNASLDTIWIGAASLAGTAIRANAIQIGSNSSAGTAAGKITVSDALAFNLLTQSLNLSSGGAVEAADNLDPLGNDTITLAGGLAVQSIGAVALRGDVDEFAVDTSGGTQSVRFIDSDEITIGNVDGVSGILAGTLFLEAGNGAAVGGIAQADGATIQATSLGLRADGSIRLDQSNEFSLVAADAFENGFYNDIYIKTGFGLSVSQVADGAPGGTPAAVAGISGDNVTLVTGGNITQDGNAPVTATGAFLATVAEGSSVSLDSSSNNFAQAPLVAALTSTGGLGLAADVTIVNSGAGGIILGQAGILTVELLSSGSGYTSQPTVGFSVGGVATAGTAAAILGLATITVSSGGAGYLSSPVVTITGGGGVGATALAVVDSNPLSTTYGQVTGITVTNPGTGYTTLPTVTLAGGSPAQAATVTGGTAASLLLQRINVSNSGIAQSYTANPTVTLSGGGATSQGTATATVGGVAGYLPSSSTSILGGITGNLSVINSGGGNFTDGTGFSVDGTSTFGSTGAITLDSSANYMLGTITVGSDSSVTINNSISSILGNFTGVDGTGVPDGTALFGPLTLGSMGSIYQGTSGGFLNVNGNTTFLATSTALAGGTPNGAVIINNANNIFVGTVAATGTRVVIRDSTALNLGAVTASTSLAATSTSAGISQSGVISSTGAASFAAAAGQSIVLGDSSNVFGSTVSFSALSGQLQDVTVTDSTALNLQALNILGDLVATGAGLTQSGILQAANADLRSTGSGNSLNLSTFNNNFSGQVRIRSDGNASLFDNGPLIIGNLASSQVTGNLTLSSAGAFSQTQSITVNGTGTSSISTIVGGVTFSQNITLANGNLAIAPANTFTQSGGTLSLGTGTLAISSTGLVLQTGGNMVVAGTVTANSGGAAITLTSATNDFQGAVTLTGGVTQITDGVGGLTLGTVNTGDLTAITTAAGGALNLGQGTVTGFLTATTSNGNITQNGILTVTGATTLTAGTGNIVLGSANSLANVTVNSATDVTLRNTALTAGTSLYPTLPTTLQNLTLIFDNSAATLSANPSTLTGSLSITAGGGAISSVNPIAVSGATTLSAGSSAITFDNAANDFVGTVTIGGTGVVTMKDANNLTLVGQQSLNLGNITTVGAFTVSSPANITSTSGTEINAGGTITLTAGNNADVKVDQNDNALIGSVNVAGTFTLRTDATIGFTLGGAGGFGLSAGQLNNFRVGTFAPVADGANITIPTAFNYGGIQNLSLTTLNSGNIIADGAVSVGTLSLSSAGTASFNAVNSISSLGTVSIGSQGLTFRNNRGLNLAGTATMPGRLSLEVAGQFYNQTGQSQPLGRVAGGSVIKSLSLMGGLPNQISGLAGFSYRYDGQMPTSGNVMSYAVSPLTMFAPGGTTIAGVDLGGTQTGGGQFNTFLTGSDNLNWMISDFGRFDMPTVKPSGMDYILYPQRVEPETRTLPAATLGQLERELGRPPTLEEIQAREVAVREAAMVRSGAILERSSFDAVEDEVDKQESAEVPAQVIDGGKPQADARGQRSEDGMQKAEVGSRPSFAPSPASAGGASEGFGPQARKTQSVRQGSNGPILRSGPIRSVALRAEPVDATQIIQAERERAEVGVAAPVAGR